MVETAITMPLLVFIILGSLQLGLMHQARLMTKYAAFKAVRVGAMNHGRVPRMKIAAAMVLMPVSSYSSGGKDYFFKSKTTGEYLANAPRMRLNMHAPGVPMVDVVICSPTKSDHTGDQYSGSGIGSAAAAYADPGQSPIGFDMPQTQDGASWQKFEVTRLVIQVTLNYRMPIPFANMMLYHIFRSNMNTNLRRVTRTGSPTAMVPKVHRDGQDGRRDALALAGIYIIPIRATYAMRMQSDLYPNGPDLPAANNCVIPYAN